MDVRTAMDIRRQKSEAIQDMDRATTRATDAATRLRRQVSVFENPMQIDLGAVDACVADIRESQRQYTEAQARRDEARKLLGE